jgi:transcriptional regulator with XRE-family HTH domain
VTPGEQLRAWRKGQGITAASLASRLGVTQQAVSCWERGRYAPDESRRCRVERIAGIPATAWVPVDESTPGGQLRAWRLRSGWTQGRIAAEVGCTPAAVSYWESGTNRPLPICAQRLERITDIPADAWRELRRAS